MSDERVCLQCGERHHPNYKRAFCSRCDSELAQASGSGVPAEVFPVGYFIKEEMEARGWTLDDMLDHLSGDRQVNRLWLEIEFAVGEFDHDIRKDITLGDDAAQQLAQAFGTSKELWLNLAATYHKHQNKRAEP